MNHDWCGVPTSRILGGAAGVRPRGSGFARETTVGPSHHHHGLARKLNSQSGLTSQRKIREKAEEDWKSKERKIKTQRKQAEAHLVVEAIESRPSIGDNGLALKQQLRDGRTAPRPPSGVIAPIGVCLSSILFSIALNFLPSLQVAGQPHCGPGGA